MESAQVLQKYVAALNAGDADQVAALYAVECSFVDGGARPMGFPDTCGEGREGVRAAFAGVFQTFKVKAEIVKLNPNSMEYDVTLSGPGMDDLYIPCIGAATLDGEGLISEYIVRPR